MSLVEASCFLKRTSNHFSELLHDGLKVIGDYSIEINAWRTIQTWPGPREGVHVPGFPVGQRWHDGRLSMKWMKRGREIVKDARDGCSGNLTWAKRKQREDGVSRGKVNNQ